MLSPLTVPYFIQNQFDAACDHVNENNWFLADCQDTTYKIHLIILF